MAKAGRLFSIPRPRVALLRDQPKRALPRRPAFSARPERFALSLQPLFSRRRRCRRRGDAKGLTPFAPARVKRLRRRTGWYPQVSPLRGRQPAQAARPAGGRSPAAPLALASATPILAG